MKPMPLPPELELDLPNGVGIDFPPPVLPTAEFCQWLQSMHEERARRGTLEPQKHDPTRGLPSVPFRFVD